MKIQAVNAPVVRAAARPARSTAAPPTLGRDRYASSAPPLNPFRPLFGATRSLESTASQGGLGGALAGLGLLVTVPADLADAVTRPLQLLAWPLAYADYALHRSRTRR